MRAIAVIKIFALFIYWCLSFQGIIFLLNYPADLTFYLALAWILMNVYFTYYLISKNKLK